MDVMFIGLFAVVCVIAIVFVVTSKMKQTNEKKALLQSDGNLVEIMFDYHATPASKLKVMGNPGETSYVLHSVNGREPEVISESIIVPAGNLRLDVEFFQGVVNKRLADSLTRKDETFLIEAGKAYQITYDYMENKFCCNATK